MRRPTIIRPVLGTGEAYLAPIPKKVLIFLCCRSSIIFTCWSVIFCTSSRPRFSSSSEI